MVILGRSLAESAVVTLLICLVSRGQLLEGIGEHVFRLRVCIVKLTGEDGVTLLHSLGCLIG